MNERGLLNLSKKRCVVVWRRQGEPSSDAAAVPSRVCPSCGTRFFCLIVSKAEQTQAGGGVICCWKKKDPSENLISQRSKGVMHEAGAVCTIFNVDNPSISPTTDIPKLH